ncbi:hypothetical protein M7I_0983 [Glarea lozoyensis 74030]|uniref:Uncharacterized protein n=1 Tax=Glarea lozoyensis (strain ATCC 74030 / MF5533) TaxID=1104152 RepID=H0EEU8_GLAL7|nr:hypothetical protein M7I_0983 [Glarea lozoyensis 74030]
MSTKGCLSTSASPFSAEKDVCPVAPAMEGSGGYNYTRGSVADVGFRYQSPQGASASSGQGILAGFVAGGHEIRPAPFHQACIHPKLLPKHTHLSLGLRPKFRPKNHHRGRVLQHTSLVGSNRRPRFPPSPTGTLPIPVGTPTTTLPRIQASLPVGLPPRTTTLLGRSFPRIQSCLPCVATTIFTTNAGTQCSPCHPCDSYGGAV